MGKICQLTKGSEACLGDLRSENVVSVCFVVGLWPTDIRGGVSFRPSIPVLASVNNFRLGS